MDKNSLSHTFWNYKYYIVFVLKYGGQIIHGNLKQDVGEILRDLCERKEIKIIEVEYCLDYIHVLLEIPSKYSISQTTGYLKGKSSLVIFDHYASLEYRYGSRHFWCQGYYVDAVGESTRKIQDYIKNQLKEDYTIDQINMKKFVDPLTGELVNKSKK